MTDPTTSPSRPELDNSTVDRLDRLRQRRARAAQPKQAPAAASKVVAASASAIAVLGLIAAYGQGDGPEGGEIEVVDPSIGQASMSTSTSNGTPTIVVVIDAEAVSQALGSGQDVATPDGARIVTLSAPDAPRRVELAVPAPRVIAESGQGSTSAPQATSSGS